MVYSNSKLFPIHITNTSVKETVHTIDDRTGYWHCDRWLKLMKDKSAASSALTVEWQQVKTLKSKTTKKTKCQHHEHDKKLKQQQVELTFK